MPLAILQLLSHLISLQPFFNNRQVYGNSWLLVIEIGNILYLDQFIIDYTEYLH